VSWREFVTERAHAGDDAAQSALRGLRYQDQRERRHADRETGGMTGPGIAARPAERRLRGLEFRVRLDGTVAYHDGGDILRREVIRDEGSRIVVRQQSDGAIAAALRLAAERWGGEVTINGSSASKERALHIAMGLGISARNPELQKRQREAAQRRSDVERLTLPRKSAPIIGREFSSQTARQESHREEIALYRTADRRRPQGG